jgi:hypothetical protein
MRHVVERVLRTSSSRSSSADVAEHPELARYRLEIPVLLLDGDGAGAPPGVGSDLRQRLRAAGVRAGRADVSPARAHDAV